jgi:hypothetical protein
MPAMVLVVWVVGGGARFGGGGGGVVATTAAAACACACALCTRFRKSTRSTTGERYLRRYLLDNPPPAKSAGPLTSGRNHPRVPL